MLKSKHGPIPTQLLILLLVFFHGIPASFFVLGQDGTPIVTPPNPANVTSPTAPAPGVKPSSGELMPASPPVLEENAVKPDGFYAFDKDSGNKVMVPGITFQEIQQMLDRRDGLQAGKEPFSFESTQVNGVVVGEYANLELQFRMRVDLVGDQWTRVPLALPGVYLTAPIEVEGADEFHLELASVTAENNSAADATGYLGYWVRLKISEPKDIVIRGKFRAQVVDQAGQLALDLRLPQSPTQISMRIPETGWDVQISGRGEELQLDTTSKESTGLLIDSDGGSLSLRWQRREEQAGPLQVLDAEGTWTMSWPAQADRLRATVNLSVKNLRGPVETFEIEIGEVAEVSPETFVANPNLRLTRLSGEGNRWQISPPEGDLPRRAEPLRVLLVLDLRVGNATANKPFRLPNVEVVGSLRQRGQVRLKVPRPGRLRWLLGSTVRSLPADAVVSVEDRSYAFEYNRVPIDLSLWTEDPQEQMSLSRKMKISVGPQSADLQMTVQGNTNAVGGQPIEIDIREWQLLAVRTSTGPLSAETYHLDGRVLTVEAEALQQSGFRDAAPLQLSFHLPITNAMFAAELPQLSVRGEASRAVIEAAEVDVRAENGWLFFYDAESSVGLDRNLSVAASADLVSLKVRPLNTPAKLAGHLLPPIQDIRAEAQITAVATERQIDLSESLQLQVNSVPITMISVKLMEGDRLELWQVSLADGTPIATVSDSNGMKIVPQKPLGLGVHRLFLKRSIPVEPTLEGTPVTLPIVQVTVPGALLGTEIPVNLSATDGLRLEAVGPENSAPLENLEFVDWPLQGLKVTVRKPPPQSSNYRIEKVWLQTFAGGEQTRERATLHVLQPPRRMRLPADFLPANAKLHVTVGGQDVSFVRSKDQMLEFDIPDGMTAASIEISVWRPTQQRGWIRSLKPLLEPWTVNASDIYWQIILPSNEHALQLSSGAGTAMRWRWDDWRFRRVAKLDDQNLAQWGGSPTETVRPVGNRYLIASVGGLDLRAITIERSLLWSLVSGLVLSVSICWMYLPRTRHAFSVIIASLAVAGAGFVWPDATLLCVQLGIAATLFVFAMLGLRQIAMRQPQRSALGPAPVFRTEGSTRRPSPTQPAIIEPSSNRGGDFSLQPAGDSRR